MILPFGIDENGSKLNFAAKPEWVHRKNKVLCYGLFPYNDTENHYQGEVDILSIVQISENGCICSFFLK